MISFLRKTRQLLLLAFCSLLLVTAGCQRSISPTSQPRSTLGDREVGNRYYKPPKKHKARKRQRKKVKVAGTYNPYVEASKKRYRKMRRKMKKPQYSDPMYFGHKKKPKKRKRGKRKLCKECGIVH